MTNYLKLYIPELLLQYFPADKILHFFVSFLLFILFIFIRKIIIKENGCFRILLFSFRDVIIIGVLKEIIDFFGKGNPQFGDIIANFLGLFFALYLVFFVRIYYKLLQSNKIIYEKRLLLSYKRSKNIFVKIKYLILFLLIWFLNIFYLILKIPILSFLEIFIFIKSLFLKRKKRVFN